MDERHDGGAAFPAVGLPRHSDYENARGMSLRDWFAGQALAGLLAADPARHIPNGITPEEARRTLANEAYVIADAMLEERTQGERTR